MKIPPTPEITIPQEPPITQLMDGPNPRRVTGASAVAGKLRLTITSHGLTTGDKIVIDNVVSPHEANGTWTITVIDANTVELNESTHEGMSFSSSPNSTVHHLPDRLLLNDSFEPLRVTGAVESGGKIRITALNHGLTNYQRVRIHGVTNPTNANGRWTVIDTSTNEFTLLESTWTGPAFTSSPSSTIYELRSPYLNQWDEYALLNTSGSASLFYPDPTAVESSTQLYHLFRLRSRFTTYPHNAKQIVRFQNKFHVFTESFPNLYWHVADVHPTNWMRPKGNDLTTYRLAGVAAGRQLSSTNGARSLSAISNATHIHTTFYCAPSSVHTIRHAQYDGLSWSQSDIHTGTDANTRSIDIAFDHDGTPCFTWCANNKLFFARAGSSPVEISLASIQLNRPLAQTGTSIPPLASEANAQDAYMALDQDGSMWIIFRFHFAIYIVKRDGPTGSWSSPAKVVEQYAYHPSITIYNGRPLIVYLRGNFRQIRRDWPTYELWRGNACYIGYAHLTAPAFSDLSNWTYGKVFSTSVIHHARRGVFNAIDSSPRDSVPWPDQIGPPVLSIRHGVPTVYWASMSRGWIYCSRFLSSRWSTPQEVRGPTELLHHPISVERTPPDNQTGIFWYGATAGGRNRCIFDRILTGSIVPSEDRHILFFDEHEIQSTENVTLNINKFERVTNQPVVPCIQNHTTPNLGEYRLEPVVIGFHNDQCAIDFTVTRWDNSVLSGQGAVSSDLTLTTWSRNNTLKDTIIANSNSQRATEFVGCFDVQVSPRGLLFWSGSRYIINPDPAAPATERFIRYHYSASASDVPSHWLPNWGIKWFVYGQDTTSDGRPNIWSSTKNYATVLKAQREGTVPQIYSPNCPEYVLADASRTYDKTGRAWGIMFTKDGKTWFGTQHHVQPTSPYTLPLEGGMVHTEPFPYTYKSRIYLHSMSHIPLPGREQEDQIYVGSLGFYKDAWNGTTPGNALSICLYNSGYPGIPAAEMRLAISRDELNFSRVLQGQSIFPAGEIGTWDSGILFSPRFCEYNGFLYMIYRGTPMLREGEDMHRNAESPIGLARIRSWSLTYYSTSNQGSITTIPFSLLSPRSLFINAQNVYHTDDLSVQLQDEFGNPIPSFERGHLKFVDNPVDNLVVWNTNATISPGTYKAKITIRSNVLLHSFRFGDPQPDGSTNLPSLPLFTARRLFIHS